MFSLCAQGKGELQHPAFTPTIFTAVAFHAIKTLHQPAFAQTGFCTS